MLVNTVRENFEEYLRHEVEKAKDAQRIQGMIAHPTKREFAGMVREQLLTDCPVTVRDVDNANQIFGPDLTNLRGKMTRTNRNTFESNRGWLYATPMNLYNLRFRMVVWIHMW